MRRQLEAQDVSLLTPPKGHRMHGSSTAGGWHWQRAGRQLHESCGRDALYCADIRSRLQAELRALETTQNHHRKNGRFSAYLGQFFHRGATAPHPCSNAHPRQPLHVVATPGSGARTLVALVIAHVK